MNFMFYIFFNYQVTRKIGILFAMMCHTQQIFNGSLIQDILGKRGEIWSCVNVETEKSVVEGDMASWRDL